MPVVDTGAFYMIKGVDGMLKAGDTINGIKIARIHDDKAESDKDGRRWTQRLSALAAIRSDNSTNPLNTYRQTYVRRWLGKLNSARYLYRRYAMNKKRPLALASILIFCAIFIPVGLVEMSISAGMQEDDAEIFILEGLKGVTVEVVQPVSGFEDKPKFMNPVNVDELHATVQRLLSASGVEVVGSPSDDPEMGHIVVTVNAWKGKVSIDFILQVKTELYQHTALVRDSDLQILIPTWPLGEKALEVETPVVVTRGEIARTVRDEIEAQVTMLILDYFEANPELEPKLDISNMMTGTIRYVDIEGGCYYIFADNGGEYRPVNLPREYRQHGLRVAFCAIRTEWCGIPFGGIPVKLTRIVKL